jgi:hypothetical protein
MGKIELKADTDTGELTSHLNGVSVEEVLITFAAFLAKTEPFSEELDMNLEFITEAAKKMAKEDSSGDNSHIESILE